MEKIIISIEERKDTGDFLLKTEGTGKDEITVISKDLLESKLDRIGSIELRRFMFIKEGFRWILKTRKDLCFGLTLYLFDFDAMKEIEKEAKKKGGKDAG